MANSTITGNLQALAHENQNNGIKAFFTESYNFAILKSAIMKYLERHYQIFNS